jgi:hypothetical protein
MQTVNSIGEMKTSETDRPLEVVKILKVEIWEAAKVS